MTDTITTEQDRLRARFHIQTIPIYAIQGGKCACGHAQCSPLKAAKHPISWSREAKPGEPYAVKTGNGLAVLDLDLKGRSLEEVIKLVEDNFGPIPKTFTVRTGSGGVHFYFRTDTPVRNDTNILGPKTGVDVRGENGIVIGPGSPHRSGRAYEIISDEPLAYMPAALLDLVRKKVIPKEEKNYVNRTPLEEGPELEAAVSFFVRRISEEMPPSIEGQEGDKALWQVAKQAASLNLPPELSCELTLQHFNPRCEPAWDEKTIERKMNQAWEKSYVPSVDADTINFIAKRRQLAIDGETPEVLKFEVPEFVRTRKIPDPNHTYDYLAVSGLDNEKLKSLSAPQLVYVMANHPSWDGVWQWDIRSESLVCVCPPLELDAERGRGLTERDKFAIRCWLNAQGSSATDKDIELAVNEAARANGFHSIREYLDALPGCDIKEAEQVFDGLAKVLFSDGAQEIESDFLKKFCIASVRRAYRPGEQVDTMLVLYGAQGLGKSSFARILFGEDNYLEQMPEKLAGRDASHMLAGKWCVEFAELETILRLDQNEVKSFLTRRIDEYRAFGNGARIRTPRETVFIGTTNEQDFLRDSTGNRRYWPVEVTKKLDLDLLTEARDTIWGAAKTLAESNEPHFYHDEDSPVLDAIRERYLREDEWAESVLEYVKGRDFVKGFDIFDKAIVQGEKGSLLKYGRKEQTRIGGILKQLGCKPSVRNGTRGYLVSFAVKNSEPSLEQKRQRKSDELANTHR